MLALEADWPDAEALDRYVRQRPGHRGKIGKTKGDPGYEDEGEVFERFPTWMWRNKEMQDLVEWIRDHNASLAAEKKVGIYGMDLYSLGSSMKAIISYLDKVDPAMAKEARKRYGCLEPYTEEPQE